MMRLDPRYVSEYRKRVWGKKSMWRGALRPGSTTEIDFNRFLESHLAGFREAEDSNERIKQAIRGLPKFKGGRGPPASPIVISPSKLWTEKKKRGKATRRRPVTVRTEPRKPLEVRSR